MQLNLLGFVASLLNRVLYTCHWDSSQKHDFDLAEANVYLRKWYLLAQNLINFVLMRLSPCLPGRIHSMYELECNYILYLWRLNDPLTQRGLWLRDLISINELNLNTCNEAISPIFHTDVPKQGFRSDRPNATERAGWPWFMSFVSTNTWAQFWTHRRCSLANLWIEFLDSFLWHRLSPFLKLIWEREKEREGEINLLFHLLIHWLMLGCALIEPTTSMYWVNALTSWAALARAGIASFYSQGKAVSVQ